jgi:hypothetical protein
MRDCVPSISKDRMLMLMQILIQMHDAVGVFFSPHAFGRPMVMFFDEVEAFTTDRVMRF